MVLTTSTATPTGGDQWRDVDLSGADLQVGAEFLVARILSAPPGNDGNASLRRGTDPSDPDDRSFVRHDTRGTIRMSRGFQDDITIRATVAGQAAPTGL